MSRRLLSPLRLYTRLAHAPARSPRVVLARRMMSSEAAHAGGSTSGDRTWMIGSALVFGPLFLYFVSPSARKDHNGAVDHGHTKNHRDKHEDKHAQPAQPPPQQDDIPIADDEGTKVSGQEVKESIEKALEADSPKDAHEREEVVAKESGAEPPATETHSEAESTAETTTVSEPNPTPDAPVANDVATQVTGGDKATTPETAESKA